MLASLTMNLVLTDRRTPARRSHLNAKPKGGNLFLATGLDVCFSLMKRWQILNYPTATYSPLSTLIQGLSLAITRELDPACSFQLAVVQGQAVSAERPFQGVVLCVQRGWRLQKESVTCLFINVFPLGVSVKPAQAV